MYEISNVSFGCHDMYHDSGIKALYQRIPTFCLLKPQDKHQSPYSVRH